MIDELRYSQKRRNEKENIEVWASIPNYEGLYEASSLGRIRTAEGKITSNARFKKRVWKQRILKQKIETSGRGRKDARVSLWKDGKEKTELVSRLVNSAFNGYEKDLTVNHKDGNPLNNNVENLEWMTLRQNIKDGFESGLYKKTCKPIILHREKDKLYFRSLSQASIFLGQNRGYINNAISHGRAIRNCDGLEYSYSFTMSEMPTERVVFHS